MPGASTHDVNEAGKQGVVLCSLGPDPRDEFDDASASQVSKSSDLKDVQYWIGHDIITGEFAAKVKDVADADVWRPSCIRVIKIMLQNTLRVI